ncbi:MULTISPECIES: DUF3307 domain-containing protein [unclassified Shimia]|uniref:DUF3307 domain-containing protein n=1 Tax=unclassified Shimia TaxID=2630038 RepID=UPI001ADD367B|nr:MULTISPECIES: DUF3307 domain-containing protein [unclassified Shimia]MBO9475067.1 DUF3307 domain-containing protein [Shimia sp. R10_1]MDA5557942.1 DUF3307 domain-containing protein [Shimia sp. MMG029]
MDQITTILLLVAAFQIKHLVADFFLQNAKMIMGRERYWHMGRAQHAGIHAVFSVVVLALFGTGPMVIFWMVLAEFIVHFHIDWGKARFSVDRALTPEQPMYWYAMGFDQALHQLTYLVMTWAYFACLTA